MAEKIISKIRVQLRYDTETNWKSAQSPLKAGEVGIASDTHVIKAGDGSSLWDALPELGKSNAIVKGADGKIAEDLIMAEGHKLQGTATAAEKLATAIKIKLGAEDTGVDLDGTGDVVLDTVKLDENGEIPAKYLPSYVDDIVEVATEESLKTAVEGGKVTTVEGKQEDPSKSKIYYAVDTGAVYRYTGDSGSAFVRVSADIGSVDHAVTANQLANTHTFTVAGDATSAPQSFDGTQDVTLNVTLADTGVEAKEYGTETKVVKVTVDSKGRITHAEETPIGNLDWSVIATGKPSTLDGYGITDALKAGETIAVADGEKALATWSWNDGEDHTVSITGKEYGGKAAEAGKLTNKLTIGSKSFDGSEAVTITADDLHVTGVAKLADDNTMTGSNTFTQAIKLNAEGNATIDATNYTGKAATAGAADTATKLAAPVNINGVAFDGSAPITIDFADPSDGGTYVFQCGGATVEE